MKTKLITQLAALLLLSTLNPQLSTVFAQGSLTPPGAPGPTMKSLDQIEARTAITNTSSLVTISQPGSYYLTHNLTVSSGDGIDINTNGVTLDLNGFTISSTAASATGNGILLNSGLQNITVANGFIQGGVTNNGSGVYSGSGFGYGIYYSGKFPVNVLMSKVSVSGCLYHGIYLNVGDSTVVESCTVRTVGGYGIYASTIKSSSAIDCGSHAIDGDQVADCRGISTSGFGLYATTAQNCYGYSSGGSGLSASTAQNCYGQSSTSGTGLYATTAQNCSGFSTSGHGLYAYSSASDCYGYSSSGTGIYAYNAAFCTGSRPGGTAIQAIIANGCIAASGTNIITYKYNMP
jgi:hypothetical protein